MYKRNMPACAEGESKCKITCPSEKQNNMRKLIGTYLDKHVKTQNIFCYNFRLRCIALLYRPFQEPD